MQQMIQHDAGIATIATHPHQLWGMGFFVGQYHTAAAVVIGAFTLAPTRTTGCFEAASEAGHFEPPSAPGFFEPQSDPGERF